MLQSSNRIVSLLFQKQVLTSLNARRVTPLPPDRSAEGIARSPCAYQESPGKPWSVGACRWPPPPRSGPAASRSPPAGPAAAAGSAFPAHFAAPYLQISSSDAGDMAADMAATGDEVLHAGLPHLAVRLHSRLGGRRLQRGRLQLADQRPSGGRRQRHHLVRRCGRHRARADLHERLAAHRRLPERGEHHRFYPAGLRHRGRRPVGHRRHVPARPGARRAAGAGPGGAGRLHPRRRPERAAHRHRLGVRAAAGRQGQGREGVRRQHHDDGLRRRVQRPRGRRVRRAGRPPASCRACTGSPPRRPTT